MRQRIEKFLIEEEAARQRRAAISRDEDLRAWARADAAWNEVRGEISAAGRDAIRNLGLARDFSRALANTGFAVRSIGLDVDARAVVVSLEGEPETPAQQLHAADPAVTDAIHRVADDFYSRTALEVHFPYGQLTDY